MLGMSISNLGWLQDALLFLLMVKIKAIVDLKKNGKRETESCNFNFLKLKVKEV